MIPAELPEAVLDAPRFRGILASLSTRAVLADFPVITPTEEPASINWSDALLFCSVLTQDDTERAQDAALRVAQGCLISRDAESAHRDAAAALLDCMGNRLAVVLAEKRERVSSRAWTHVPSPLQLDVIRRRLELSIPLAGGRTIAGNTFQRRFWSAAQSTDWVSVSAPTSAGKSFIVKGWFEERVAAMSQFRGVYLVPTRALIEEVSNDLRKQFSTDIGIYTIPWDADIGTTDKEIHVLTQERLNLLHQRFPLFVANLLFVDEAQKVGDGARGILLQQVLEETVRRGPTTQVIFASALVLNPELLLETAPPQERVAIPIISETITVNQNLLWADQVPYQPIKWRLQLVTDGSPADIGTFLLPARPVPEGKRLPLVAFALGGADPGNVVYVNGAAAAEKAAHQIFDALGPGADVSGNEQIAALRDLIQRTIHPQYALASVLQRGVAFHYGNMPLLVRNEVERLFRDGLLRYLICTSTLLEGVNLPCRNLFARNPKKGNKKLMSAADFWNLAGRAGRWGQEFQGNIICVDAMNDKLWPERPERRQRQPLSRATDATLQDPTALVAYIEAGAPVQQARDMPMLESMFSFLAKRVASGTPLATLPGLDVSKAALLEAQIRDVLASIDLSADVVSRHAGLGPLAMQRLLVYFREHQGYETLLLAPPESWDATETYVSALARSNDFLAASFGPPARQFSLALLITSWMRGHSLARIIADRITYLKDHKKPVKLATEIRMVMQDIEKFARFEAPKYLACYVDVLRHYLNEIGHEQEAAGLPDINMMLELGVSRTTEVSLMALGLSRTSAVALSELIVADDLSRAECITWLQGRDLGSLNLPGLIQQEVAELLTSATGASDR